MKNSIFLILSTPPPYGGGEIQSLYLKEAFSSKQNYILFAYSRKSSNKTSQGQFTFKNIFWGLYLVLKSSCLLIRYRPKVIYSSIPKGFSAFIRTAIVLWFAKRLGVKVLGELAGVDFQFLQAEGIQKKIGLYFLNQVDTLRVLGESVKKNLERYNIKRTITMDNGIYVPPDAVIPRDIIFQTQINLLYVGALNFSKGIKNLVYAVSTCKQKKINIHLNLVGEWSNAQQKEDIEGYIRSNLLEEYITFHGLTHGQRKWNVFKKCAILVHPTYWDGQPLTILEAMGCGLAIITTPIGAIPDTVRHNVNGIILSENTPQKVFEAIELFYNNREYLLQVSTENIQTYNRRFTAGLFCERMESWFESSLITQKN